ncbi:MAG: hypothetical protein EOP56_13185 [Sphingobacteriales bacterium]|nr:MAG: hypothetical protein EOP56_13185 [Sphingobacteriales bacterium]
MKNLISERLAIHTIITILSLVIIFHILVLTGVIPYNIVWGGRLQTKEQMVKFETMSILINIFMIAIVAVHAGYLQLPVNRTVIRIILWLLAGLFAMNTIGNLLSTNSFEMLVFTPVTLVLSLLFIRLVIVKR